MNINKSRKYIRFSISFQFRNLEKNALYFYTFTCMFKNFMFIYFNYDIRKENYFQIFFLFNRNSK